MPGVADGKDFGHFWNDSFRGVQQSGVFLRVLLSHNMKETRISGVHRIKTPHQLSDHVSHFAIAGHLSVLPWLSTRAASKPPTVHLSCGLPLARVQCSRCHCKTLSNPA